jgi:hypothetical protein
MATGRRDHSCGMFRHRPRFVASVVKVSTVRHELDYLEITPGVSDFSNDQEELFADHVHIPDVSVGHLPYPPNRVFISPKRTPQNPDHTRACVFTFKPIRFSHRSIPPPSRPMHSRPAKTRTPTATAVETGESSGCLRVSIHASPLSRSTRSSNCRATSLEHIAFAGACPDALAWSATNRGSPFRAFCPEGSITISIFPIQ